MPPRRLALLVAALTGAAGLAAAATSDTGLSGSSLYRVCSGGSRAQIVSGQIRYCGPATARLNAFPGVRFQNGMCYWNTEEDAPTMHLKLGSRAFSARTNNGLRFMGLTVSTRARLVGAEVVAYSHGHIWQGSVISKYTGTLHGGSFIARGARGSRGRVRGSFRCPTWDGIAGG